MSLHKSLKRKDALQRRRNVLTRAERLERLKEEEEWDPETMSVFGLPKVKPRVITAPSARLEEEEEEELEGVEGEGLPAEESETVAEPEPES